MLQRKDSVAQHMNAHAEGDSWNFNEPDGPHNIQYEPTEQGKIKLITFPKLIQKLTSAKNYGKEKLFLNIVIIILRKMKNIALTLLFFFF